MQHGPCSSALIFSDYTSLGNQSGYPIARFKLRLRTRRRSPLVPQKNVTTEAAGDPRDKSWCLALSSSVYPVVNTYLRTVAASRSPASLANLAALSVASHVKSGSERPKWPYAAVFR